MNELRKAAQMALEALIWHDETMRTQADSAAITALRAALAQPDPIILPKIKGDKAEPEQEPVTFDAFVKQIRDKAIYETIYADTEGRDILVITLLDAYVLMRHTAPPQRKPLTEDEIDGIAINYDGLPNSFLELARAIEKAHGIGVEHE
jgi:hypothetical protein